LFAHTLKQFDELVVSAVLTPLMYWLIFVGIGRVVKLKARFG